MTFQVTLTIDVDISFFTFFFANLDNVFNSRSSGPDCTI
ncbi:hypothetical protein 04086_4663 [Escherichia phage 04086]|nr:hypothetical protein 04086_4663 [Escherichia phage 04086]